jgi:hypothetical protein
MWLEKFHPILEIQVHPSVPELVVPDREKDDYEFRSAPFLISPFPCRTASMSNQSQVIMTLFDAVLAILTPVESSFSQCF